MITDAANDLTARDLGEAPSRVAPLSELHDFEVADGYPEIRGWDVRDSGGRSIGYVYDLLVDTEALRARYLDVELHSEFAGPEADRRVLIPLETVGLDGTAEEVQLQGIDASEVHTLVPYARRGVPREREAALPRATGLADVAAPPPAGTEAEFPAESRPDHDRAVAREGAVPAAESGGGQGTRSEEQPRVDAPPLTPRDETLGDITVRKTVETERVTQRAPVLREELEIERRPLRPGEEINAGEHGDEIRIPIMAEEIVIEKRLVAKEVLIIRKRRITEEQAIEAEVRREQVRVDDPLGRVRKVGKSGGAEGRK